MQRKQTLCLEPRCPAIEEQMKERWSTNTMAFFSAIKENKDKLFAGQWIQLEVTILSELGQSQKDKYRMFFVISKSYILHRCKNYICTYDIKAKAPPTAPFETGPDYIALPGLELTMKIDQADLKPTEICLSFS